MGTLHQQPVRPRLDLRDVIETAIHVQEQASILGELSAYDAITIAMELRLSDLDQADRDVQDERWSHAVSEISETIREGIAVTYK